MPGLTLQSLLPGVLACAAGHRDGAVVDGAGVVERMTVRDLAFRLRQSQPPLLCHAKAVARRLGIAPFPALDVLDLFAFVHPARFCVPTPRGVRQALDLPAKSGLESEAAGLFEVALSLLNELARRGPLDATATSIAWAMARANWPWGGIVLKALGAGGDSPHSKNLVHGLKIWMRLPEWSDVAPRPPSDHIPVAADAVRNKLADLIGADQESRQVQGDYAVALGEAFDPRDIEGEPPVVLAEAGTGIGKTLGYMAPAGLWSEKNSGPVWISTFTRNLQRQVDGELDRLYPAADEKRRRVVVRKGRENYLCLLNYEEAVNRLGLRPGDAIALGLMARWAEATRDGDMVGGDFPGWLADLTGRGLTVDLTDTRGECVYSACPHYGKCFVERSIRRARRAHIIVANHALVLIQAALGDADEALRPARIVFDEGHHLFEAADSAFAATLSGQETGDLRRWLRGGEETGRSRARGLKDRIGDLLATQAAQDALSLLLSEATVLPGPGWLQRIAGGAPRGPAERFLARVRQQVYARIEDSRSPYSLEVAAHPPVPGLAEAATELETALGDILAPVRALAAALTALLDDEADQLETGSRLRIEAMLRGLEKRGALPLQAWIAMLAATRAETPPRFVDWMGIERRDGADIDVGLHRHWVDPTIPLAEQVIMPAQGVAVTSATLCDAAGDWAAARARTGARHLIRPATVFSAPSPFDYATNTRVLVVDDINRNNPDQVASAYRELFKASGGGALGMFTAINRLRAVHARIAGDLEAAGLPVYAQHVEAMDTGTLIDIFRDEDRACLLGTDAVRDGVDVPGPSLRLIVFERVPWPRPTILHKSRRGAFADAFDADLTPAAGAKRYDEMLTRLKLKQAYGRLVRRATDRGVFVMLDRAFPSRFADAFPDGVEIQRLGLAAAIAETRGFLIQSAKSP